MTNIFCDYHHSGLLQSFILLFENRLNGGVFRPIGREWFDRGYWKIYDHPATVAQYLDINGATPDGTDPLNVVNEASQFIGDRAGVYFCDDIQSGKQNKAITYEAFMRSNIHVVIASIPQHIEPFRRLCNEHPLHPKLIYQVGNAWNITVDQEKMLDGIMASANLQTIPNIPWIKYHQEFDTEIFRPEPFFLVPDKKITSFVNCFATDQLFNFDFELFKRIESQLPEWQFRILGGAGRDGSAHGEIGVAKAMAESKFVWHTKNGGDGYGHIIHNASAMALPAIVRQSYYSGKMGQDLMRDGVTCIAIDGLSDAEIIGKINWYSDHTRYMEMRKNIYANFKARVDFERESNEIREFFAKLGVEFV